MPQSNTSMQLLSPFPLIFFLEEKKEEESHNLPAKEAYAEGWHHRQKDKGIILGYNINYKVWK